MLEDFRDIMIIIMAFMAIGASLLFATATFILFRKLSSTADTARDLMQEVRNATSLVSNTVVRPTIRVATVFAGARKAMGVLSRRDERKEGKGGKRK